MMQRIDKILSSMGFGSRKKVKEEIKNGMVQVDGKVIDSPTLKVDPENSQIIFHGEPIQYQEFFYFMLNKPQGYLCTVHPAKINVMDLIHEPIPNLFPCGRLDKDTEGFLLITNDGLLTHQLLSPKNRIEKQYYVELERPFEEGYITQFEKGFELQNETRYLPAKLEQLSDRSCYVTVVEGKYHEVKRMFELVGNQVTFLKRIRIHQLYLDESLEVGDYRPLTEEEILSLKECVQPK